MKKLKVKKIVSLFLAIATLLSCMTIFSVNADGTAISLKNDDILFGGEKIGYGSGVTLESDCATVAGRDFVRYLAYAENSGEYTISLDMSLNCSAAQWVSIYNEQTGVRNRLYYNAGEHTRNSNLAPDKLDDSHWQYSTAATTSDKTVSTYLKKGYNILYVQAQDAKIYGIKLTPIYDTPELYAYSSNGESFSAVVLPPKSANGFDIYADEEGEYTLTLREGMNGAEWIHNVIVNGVSQTGGVVQGNGKIVWLKKWSANYGSSGNALPTVTLNKGKNTVEFQRTAGNNININLWGLRAVKTSGYSEETAEKLMKAEFTKDKLLNFIPETSSLVNGENLSFGNSSTDSPYGIATISECFEEGSYNIDFVLSEDMASETKIELISVNSKEKTEFVIPEDAKSGDKITKTIDISGGENLFLINSLSGNASVSKIEFKNFDSSPELTDDDVPSATLKNLDEYNSFTDFTKEDSSYSFSFGSSDETAVYSLSVSAEAEEASFNIYLDGELIYENMSLDSLGDYTFSKGDHTLKLEYMGTDPNINSVSLNKKSENSGNLFEVKATDCFEMSEGATKETERVYIKPSNYIKLKVNLPKSGRYLLHFTYATTGASEWFKIENETTEETFNGVFANSPYTKNEVTTANKDNAGSQVKMFFNCSEGENIIKVTKGGNHSYIYKLGFEYIPDDAFISSAYVGGVELLGYNKITPSADTIKLIFSDNIKDGNLKDRIKITDENGLSYSFEAEAENSAATLKLTTSLQPNLKYTITAAGLELENSEIKTAKTVLFETREEVSDGKSTLTCDQIETSLESVTASGTVTAENGELISNRAVRMYLYEQGKEDLEYMCEGYTDKDGKYEITGNIDKSVHNSGKYKIYLVPQYNKSGYALKSIVYTDKDTENAIASAFENAKTTDAVKKAFSDYKDFISVKPEKDVLTVGENLYNHFISYELKSMSGFYEFYNKMYMFEALRNSADTAALEGFLYNEENCGKIGFDYDKISLIKNNKQGFLTEILAMDESDFSDYSEKFSEILDKYLYEESEKSDISLNLSDISVKKGKEFKMKLNGGQLTSVKKIELTFDFGSKNAIDSDTLSISSSEKGNKALSCENGKLTLSYEYKSPADLSELLILSLTAKEVGSYSVSYGGKIYYDFSGYEIVRNITDGSFNFSVTDSSSSSSSGKTSVKASSSTYVPTTEDKKDDTNGSASDSVYKFEDLEGFEWAEESINALLKKGVVSKADDKKFRPNDNITREEFVKLIITLLDVKASSGSSEIADFSDLPKSHWAYECVMTAVENGIISGMGDGRFGTGESITREQMAAIAERVLMLYGKTAQTADMENFSDYNEISDYAKSSVMTMKYFNIINGIGDNMFAPKNNATRAQAAKIIYELSKVVGL